MDRRSFLLGTVGSVAAGALIVKASDADVAQFAMPAVGEEVGVMRPQALHGLLAGGDLLYNSRGEVVACVREVRTLPATRDIRMELNAAWPDGTICTPPGEVRCQMLGRLVWEKPERGHTFGASMREQPTIRLRGDK